MFWSLGGRGLNAQMVEVDKKNRGETTLKEILDRHHSDKAPEIDPNTASGSILKKKADGKRKLYIYNPVWMEK